jgi:hypothetical protein
MSGRIWVVEINDGTRTAPRWHVVAWRSTRAFARSAQVSRGDAARTRVVQYVRQGGAR